MSYVKWKSSKYHVLNGFASRGLKISNGRASASVDDSGSLGGLALTDCGSDVPTDNEVFAHLPDGTDLHSDVCHKCSGGVGISKIDHSAEQAHFKVVAETTAKRFDERRIKAAKALFGN